MSKIISENAIFLISLDPQQFVKNKMHKHFEHVMKSDFTFRQFSDLVKINPESIKIESANNSNH